ncbi:TrkH family potassium uptake protein [Vagococcus xieshaowenii]|uniref:Trk family potassium uptake protein n=1 Tax=Vagococcus xieshaowenii TaxID=2562451 RepID=A0AAJ5EEB5_9ENTE|nr:TrkH family potassium uptake protein [Vagococcus xieshaowenii]QCA29014.1 Trk family potassium uptake protein [Vagococcus xieshaowenii]TFZ41011.1 Trk family potassium uptake protein [Vagococcus xieshaowenii]
MNIKGRNKRRKSLPRLGAASILALGFVGVILVGANLLTLPFFSRSNQATPFIDALFTATSATCVTGLTTLNTVQHWNSYGQAVILVLIEIGGLNFMMLPIVFFTFLKKRIQLSTRIVIKEAFNLDQVSGVMSLALYVLKLALIIQTLGTLLLAVDFIPRFGFAKGSWYALFHAVSSFCNAGFDLFGDSLVPFQNNPYIILIISALIISGGLGFIVWKDLHGLFKRSRLSLHSKIALIMTVTLLVGGFFFFYYSETANTGLLTNPNKATRLLNAFFLSVTARTAGFYAVDYSQLSLAGILMTIVLMYIGGTSGSTAGGLKTTTFGVLLIQISSLLKGRSYAEFAGRRVKESIVVKALMLFVITLMACVVAMIILSVTEDLPIDRGMEYIAFEVFSAFGTVGLTMGLTPNLTFVGKIVIILLMFIGRVGIMTVLFSLLSKHQQKEIPIQFPKENVMIG